MKKAIWLGIVLCLSLATAVLGETCDSLRLIRVKGDAIVSVPPDKAVITLGLESRQDKLEPAKQRVDSLMKVVNDLAKEYNIPEKDVRTERYVIIPANPKRTKHFVGAIVTVTITDMSVLNPFITRAVDAGVDEVRDVNFALQDPLAVRIKAREEATTAARTKAEAMLKALGATLGRVHSVAESGDTYYPSSYSERSRPTNVTLAMLDKPAEETGGEASLSVGHIEERATVEVAFEIGQ